MGEIDRRRAAEELKALMVRAHEGDRSALPQIREILDAAPSLAHELMGPAEIAERSAVGLYAKGEDLLAQEVIPRVLGQMRSELEGEGPTPLEHLLADKVAATWLQVQCYETLYAQNASKMTLAQCPQHSDERSSNPQDHLCLVSRLSRA